MKPFRFLAALLALLVVSAGIAEAAGHRFAQRGFHAGKAFAGHAMPRGRWGFAASPHRWRVETRRLWAAAPPRSLARSFLATAPFRAARPRPGIRLAQDGPPPNVLRELQRQGYRDPGGLQRRGGNYVGEATGPRGERQRVIIDSQSGRITGSSPANPGGGRRVPGGGWYGGY